MHTQWPKYSTIFIAALVVIMAGIFITEPLAAAQTNEQDDVQSTAVPGQLAPRLQNLGNHKFPVTTNSARAQLFINQGLMLAYGFNHAEAGRSFREAARLDPNCAMAYWGMALVLGPNINMAMSPEAEQPAHEIIRKAVALKKTPPKENRPTLMPWQNATPGRKNPTAARWTGPMPRRCANFTIATPMISMRPRFTPRR